MNITELRNIVKYAQNKPNTILYVISDSTYGYYTADNSEYVIAVVDKEDMIELIIYRLDITEEEQLDFIRQNTSNTTVNNITDMVQGLVIGKLIQFIENHLLFNVTIC